MRTNIDIDDDLMEKALKKTGLKTKKAVVEEGLKKLIESKNQKELLKYFGKLKWEGDLDDMRTSKHVS
jgi:Arc/MetJ family transcription regulator